MRRISALLFSVVLLTASHVSASAPLRSRSYDGRFSDLPTDSVFYSNVAALYEYGLAEGKPDGSFGVEDALTVGQTVIFAGRIRSLYRTGNSEAGPAAYDMDGGQYLRYLQDEGVLGTELDSLLTYPATRAQMAHVLAHVLPEDVLPPVHNSLVTQAFADNRFLKDVNEYTPYYKDILRLYCCGVSIGSDATGSFFPDAPITRGAAAAMLSRMVDPTLRVAPSWNVGFDTARGTTLADLVEPGVYISAPSTEREMEESIRYMLSSGVSGISFQYGGLSSAAAKQVMELALSVVKSYCEQSYNTVACSYASTGFLHLDFSAAGQEGDLELYRTESMESAILVHDRLWESGLLKPEMSDYEKALVYYTWVCENCVYDYNAGTESVSHIPYGLFHNGTAVCDGYTGAYNLFLKLEEINCTALSNESHIWTVAELDGVEYHIDTTWGDSGNTVSYEYFAMTPEQSQRLHAW